jgi:hypothetical protein
MFKMFDSFLQITLELWICILKHGWCHRMCSNLFGTNILYIYFIFYCEFFQKFGGGGRCLTSPLSALKFTILYSQVFSYLQLDNMCSIWRNCHCLGSLKRSSTMLIPTNSNSHSGRLRCLLRCYCYMILRVWSQDARCQNCVEPREQKFYNQLTCLRLPKLYQIFIGSKLLNKTELSSWMWHDIVQ